MVEGEGSCERFVGGEIACGGALAKDSSDVGASFKD